MDDEERLSRILKAAGDTRVSVPFKCGGKVMPCLVRAIITDGAPSREFIATGKVGSK